MTEKRARALHRAMWRWLAKHPGAKKKEWPGWRLQGKDEDIYRAYGFRECIACIGHACYVDCPIREIAGVCGDKNSLYIKYYWLTREESLDPAEWASVCNRMADAWRGIPKN